MPQKRLTARAVDAILPPENGRVEYWDATFPAFGLRVTEKGSKSWVLMYRREGRLRRFTVGSYPRLSLADARDKARAALHEIANPHRQAARPNQHAIGDQSSGSSTVL